MPDPPPSPDNTLRYHFDYEPSSSVDLRCKDGHLFRLDPEMFTDLIDHCLHLAKLYFPGKSTIKAPTQWSYNTSHLEPGHFRYLADTMVPVNAATYWVSDATKPREIVAVDIESELLADLLEFGSWVHSSHTNFSGYPILDESAIEVLFPLIFVKHLTRPTRYQFIGDAIENEIQILAKTKPWRVLRYCSNANNLELGTIAISHMTRENMPQDPVDLLQSITRLRPFWAQKMIELLFGRPGGFARFEQGGYDGHFWFSRVAINTDFKSIASRFKPQGVEGGAISMDFDSETESPEPGERDQEADKESDSGLLDFIEGFSELDVTPRVSRRVPPIPKRGPRRTRRRAR